jgi:hypothetical protein
MNPTLTTKLLVVGIVLVTAIGAIEAAIGAEWDLFALFLLGGALSSALLARLEASRPSIPVRRDLVAWLRNRALISGESTGAVADRALSAYRERYGHAPVQADRVDE